MGGPIAHGVERGLRKQRGDRERPPTSPLGGWFYYVVMAAGLTAIVLAATSATTMPAWLRAAVAVGPSSIVAAWLARLLRRDAARRTAAELLAGLVGWQLAPLRWLIDRYGHAVAIPLHAIAWAGTCALALAI